MIRHSPTAFNNPGGIYQNSPFDCQSPSYPHQVCATFSLCNSLSDILILTVFASRLSTRAGPTFFQRIEAISCFNFKIDLPPSCVQ